jgi:hypothetical protein
MDSSSDCSRSPTDSGLSSRLRWSDNKSQQAALARLCEDLLGTDPSSLMEEDRYLPDINFEALGDGPSATQQVWISEMQAAHAAQDMMPLRMLKICLVIVTVTTRPC